MKIPILIVEDEMIVSMEIKSIIEKHNYEVIATATNANDAYLRAQKYQPHVILMDINLKGEDDGIIAAQNILQHIHTTIIYLTAFNDDATIERAIQTNPAAYLIKPFNRQELLAAIKIALMHYNNHINSLEVKQGHLILNEEFSYDKTQGQLFCCRTPVHLTSRENELLYLLISANKSIVNTCDMENIIWPDKAPVESTRRALISRLRSKLKHQFIETLPGIGYRLQF
ncbi:MAG: response regulator [Campylobacterota bacterium]|nr:response regulator [Campylobacterota bacterium]